MGMKITLSGVKLTDQTAPKLALIDPIESSGSLFLVEPGHPTATGALPNLTNGTVFTNLFRQNALALTGIGSLSDMDAEYLVSGTITDKVRMEYTAKKGIHGYASQTSGVVTAGAGTLLSAKQGFRNYAGFKVATGHKIYTSAWVRETRLSKTQNTVTFEHGSGANSSQNVIFRQQGFGYGNAAGFIADTGYNASPSLGNRRRSSAVDATKATQNNFPAIIGTQWGAPTNSYNNAVAAFRDDLPSYVVYRIYIEDLTVSGRTYAQVDALDAALYASAFGTGGRYAGDTFTAPSTLP